MARHRKGGLVVARRRDDETGMSGRHRRRPYSLPVFAFSAAIAFVLVSVVAPQETLPTAASTAQSSAAEPQSLTLSGSYSTELSRDGYKITKRPIAVPTAKGDAGIAQAIAYEMVKARGWGDDEFSCLVQLFDKESHWNVYAENKSSGAYGIPQALPGSKMASAGADWQTNPATQISWGLRYIAGRYGTPCGAWDASQSKGWY
ncbi:hypothetical protein BH09ACT3_BH09ACT3_11010 [soil metagenome]